jgi:AcrR family transcriptional regulator
MNPNTGLRERKKQRTREAIVRAAHELFTERGYNATTLPDIAEAADVSTRTIFAYFPSKEDILFCDFPTMKEALARALAERPDGQDALDVVREFILSTHQAKRSELDEQLHRVVESDETLRSHMRARFAQLEELVAAAIAVDLGVGENDVRPQVVAASMVAAFDGLFDSESKTKPRSADEVAALIDPVMTFLRGGLEALKRPR